MGQQTVAQMAGSNSPFTSLPASTNAASDTPITFATTINHFSIQNTSAASLYYALDQLTTAAAAEIFTLISGAQVWWDCPVSVLHVYTTLVTTLNPAIGSTGITIMGRQ